jgi:hypothetical protein
MITVKAIGERVVLAISVEAAVKAKKVMRWLSGSSCGDIQLQDEGRSDTITRRRRMWRPLAVIAIAREESSR